MLDDEEAVDSELDHSFKTVIFCAQLAEELQQRCQFFTREVDAEVEKESNESSYVHQVESLLDEGILVFHYPVVYCSQRHFSNVAVTEHDQLWFYEELGAAVYIPKTFAATVDDQSKQGTLSNNILLWKRHEVLNLSLQERLESVVI